MKSKLTRMLAFALLLVLALSLCGCDINVTDEYSEECGTFNVTGGSLGKSGTVTLNGTYPDRENWPVPINNQKYKYNVSDDKVTFTRKGGSSLDGPYQIEGTYDSETNTFTVTNLTFCEVKKFNAENGGK